MPLLTLDQARAHCRADGADEDALIGLYMGAAEQHAQDFLNRAIYDDKAALDIADDPTGVVVTDAIRAAALLIVGHLYAHREEVVTGTIATRMPLGAVSLLRPYRKVMGP